MDENEESKNLKINQETMDILVANIIPTTKYFESRFDHMQYQIDEIKKYQLEFAKDVDKRFEVMQKNIDKRFDDFQRDVDKRFDDFQKDVDKRFEQVDKRFEEVNQSIQNLTLKIEQLSKTQETTLRDYIIERDRFYDKKFNNLRMFNIAIISLVVTIILKMAGVINI